MWYRIKKGFLSKLEIKKLFSTHRFSFILLDNNNFRCRAVVCCCCLDRSGSIPPPLLNNFSLSALKNEIEIEKEKMSLFLFLFLSCHWILGSRLALVSTATRQGIVGMLRISDSFSRPYQWTLVITLLSTLTILPTLYSLLIWWWSSL